MRERKRQSETHRDIERYREIYRDKDIQTKYLEQRERHRDAAEQRGREGKRRTKRQRTYRCLAKVAAAERAGPRGRTPADFCLSTCSSPPAVSVQHLAWVLTGTIACHLN